MEKALHLHLRERGYYLIKHLTKVIPVRYTGLFYIAGGAIAGPPITDIDIYPGLGWTLPLINASIIVSTKNATTYDTKPWPVQTCKYIKSDLVSLINSFDYSHIQAGISVSWPDKLVHEVAWTPAYIESRVTGRIEFTGSDYPLSSLIRAEKYHKRGTMSRQDYLRAVFATLTAIVERGFTDYDDFKDQLDAVDLAIAPEDLQDCRDDLLALYNTLRSNGAQPRYAVPTE